MGWTRKTKLFHGIISGFLTLILVISFILYPTLHVHQPATHEECNLIQSESDITILSDLDSSTLPETHFHLQQLEFPCLACTLTKTVVAFNDVESCRYVSVWGKGFCKNQCNHFIIGRISSPHGNRGSPQGTDVDQPNKGIHTSF